MRISLSSPHTLRITLTDQAQLLVSGRHGFSTIRSQAQWPVGLFLYLLDAAARMIRLQQRLARFWIEGEDGQGSNQRGRTSSRQAHTFPPGSTGWSLLVGITIARTSDEINTFTQAMTFVGHDNG